MARSAERHQERLIRMLARRPVNDIVMFDVIFAHYMNIAKTWEMRAAAAIIAHEFSEEFFSDFRGWLVSRGKKKFHRVMRNPEYLAKLVSRRDTLDWVGYEACALEAYELKTGHELPAPGAIKGKQWADEDLPAMYPRLWKKFQR